MDLFIKSKKAGMPQTERAGARAGSKKLRLNFGAVSKERVSAISCETLSAGGWVGVLNAFLLLATVSQKVPRNG